MAEYLAANRTAERGSTIVEMGEGRRPAGAGGSVHKQMIVDESIRHRVTIGLSVAEKAHV